VELAILNEPAAQLVDNRRLLDSDRAGLNAGIALHARPQGVHAYPIVTDHRPGEPGSVGPPLEQLPDHPADPRLAPSRIRLLAKLEDHVAGGQRTADGVGGTDLVAATTLRAGVELEQVERAE